MAHRHDLALGGVGAHFQFWRQALGGCDQRVVTSHLARLRQAREQRARVVAYEGRLAVHETPGAHHVAAEYLDDRLVAEAHAEHRDPPGEGTDHLHGDSGIVRRARPGGDAQVRGRKRQRLLGCQRVVAVDAHLGPEHQERLHQVVGEGVVVVDEQ